MTNNDGSKLSMQELIEVSKEPPTRKDRIVASIVALVCAGGGVCMFMWPALFSFEGERPVGRGGRTLVFFLEVVWSRPVGVVLILLALLITWGVLTKKVEEEQPPPTN